MAGAGLIVLGVGLLYLKQVGAGLCAILMGCVAIALGIAIPVLAQHSGWVCTGVLLLGLTIGVIGFLRHQATKADAAPVAVPPESGTK